MRPLLVCLHDATPAFARETRTLIDGLAPYIGRRFSCGVVPNWHGNWPLTAHSDFCAMLHAHSEELLLHGYVHHRQRGSGPVSWLAERSDEMNGLDAHATSAAIRAGQQYMAHMFGARARGFLAPAWQSGHLNVAGHGANELEYSMGYFTLKSSKGQTLPLATYTWDCGRWGMLGHLGHGLGALLHRQTLSIPSLAIHPRDIERGFWPKILRLVRTLLAAGYEPVTASQLLNVHQYTSGHAQAVV
jgi:Uncharacterized protein conserved in bacteria (DUF2334)